MKRNLLLVSCLFVCCLYLAAAELTWTNSCPTSIPEGDENRTNLYTLSATTDKAGATVTYSLGTQTGSAPFIVTDDKLGTSKVIDYEKETAFNVTFIASEDETGTTDDKPLVCNISITDVNDNPPVFAPKSYSKTIPNNTATGASILTVTATDKDATAANNQISYIIPAGKNSTLFNIAASGTITAKAKIAGTQQNITFMVLATDSGSSPLTGTATVTICLGCPSDTFDNSGKSGKTDNSGNTGTMLSVTFVGLLSMLLYFVM